MKRDAIDLLGVVAQTRPPDVVSRVGWAGRGHTRLSVDAVVYRFELRRGDEIIATGHLSPMEPYEVGDTVTIGRRQGIVRSIEPLLGESELRLVIQLVRDH